MENNARTLLNNKISQFILRIDLTNDCSLNFKSLAELLRPDYEIFKTELHYNYNVNIDTVEVNKEDFIIYILGDGRYTQIKLDSFANSIIIESSRYENNLVYKDKVAKIIETLGNINSAIAARRIGMRYINSFTCFKKTDISKILRTSESKAIKDVLDQDKIARVMLVHEYQKENFMIRVQCGIPNKFYPSVITNYDLVLDIDAYENGVQPLKYWEDSISKYNHGAYDTFIEYIRDSLIEDLK